MVVGNRKGIRAFLKKASGKRDASKSKESEYVDYASIDQQLGLKSNLGIESSYKPYMWQKESHETDSLYLIVRDQKDGVQSLRELAAEKLASLVVDNPDDLTDAIIKDSMLSYSAGWKLVWDIVANSGSDSYIMFQRFANNFGQDPKFRCHGKQTYFNVYEDKNNTSFAPSGLNSKRVECMNCRLIFSRPNHRIEYFPNLVNMGSLVMELNSNQHFKFLALLDLSSSKQAVKRWKRQSFLDIMGLPSLVALDVSGCEEVDSSIIKLWTVAIKSGQWQNLRLLDLAGCEGIGNTLVLIDLMKISQMSSSLSKKRSGLVYIRLPQFLSHNLSQSLAGDLMAVTDNWVDRKILASKDMKPRFPMQQFSRNFGLARKYLFLRQWFTRLEQPILVDPEVGRNYMKRKFILHEFVLSEGIRQDDALSGLEYFRVSWPTIESDYRSKRKHSGGNNSQPKQKIKRSLMKSSVSNIFGFGS